jgi:hypothetical protein
VTPVDEIQSAASKLRALAAAATPGPWEGVVDDHGRGQINASVWADSIGYYITETISSGDRHQDDAHYIGLMHPGVGLVLADWLGEEAALHADDQAAMRADGEGVACENFPRALAVARQINGARP